MAGGQTVAVASLILTGIATIFAAIQVVPILFPPAQESTQKTDPVQAQAPATVSPPPQTIYNTTIVAPRQTFPLISDTVVSYADLVRVTGEIDKYADKIIKVKLRVEADQASQDAISDNNGSKFERLLLSVPYACDVDDRGVDLPDSRCGGGEYVFLFKEGGHLYFANGGHIVEGYFSVEPQQGMHQGWVSTGLAALPDADARLAEQ